MRGEHWGLLVVLLVMMASMENVASWADVFTPQSVAKMAAAGLLLVRASYVPPRDEP